MSDYGWFVLENIITMLLCVFLVMGLAFVFETFHCLWGLVLLMNINIKFKPQTGGGDE